MNKFIVHAYDIEKTAELYDNICNLVEIELITSTEELALEKSKELIKNKQYYKIKKVIVQY